MQLGETRKIYRSSFSVSCLLVPLLIDPDIFLVLMSRFWKRECSQSPFTYSCSRIKLTTVIYRVGIQRLSLLLVLGSNHGSFRRDMTAVFRHLFVLSRLKDAAAEAQQATDNHAHYSRFPSRATPLSHTSRLLILRSFSFAFSSGDAIPHFHQSVTLRCFHEASFPRRLVSFVLRGRRNLLHQPNMSKYNISVAGNGKRPGHSSMKSHVSRSRQD